MAMGAQDPGAFGALLRRRRLAAGLTQEMLAERAGLSARGVQDLERGAHRPLADTVRRLGAALGLTEEDKAAFLAAARPVAPRAPPAAAGRDGPPRHNLPPQLTSFVGRERELAEIKAALERTRLLTLTGAGGCGKTRLALRAAADLLARYPDGVWLVELAPLADPAVVPAAVAAALGIPARPGQSLEATLVNALRHKGLLLLLDNCEHLLDACARICDMLLRGCDGLVALTTSRQALVIDGETSRRVPSLAVPPEDGTGQAEQLADYEAVRLFTDRALSVQPGFAIMPQNAAAVAQLCRRLDGIPLALELAAARLRSLSVDQLAARLDQAFRLLSGGSRVALPRQQTLRATLDWSYDLLADQERRLLGRLSVFAGGWTLEAAEAVCVGNGIEPEEALDLLTALVDKSLVTPEEQANGTRRYRLLETLRQYGREKLQASGDAAGVSGRHADFFVALATATLPELQSARQVEALDWLEAEDANARQALDWLVAHDDGEAAVRLAIVQARYGEYRSRVGHARATLQRALTTPGVGPATKARALAWLGQTGWILATEAVERATARRHAEEAAALADDTDDLAAQAWTRFVLGFTAGDPAEKLRQYSEALRRWRLIDDRWGIAYAADACAALAGGDERAANGFLAESDRLWPDVRQPYGLGYHRWIQGRRALDRGDLPEAEERLAEAQRLWRAVGHAWGAATIRRELGRAAQARGDLATARRLLEEGLAEYRDVRLPRQVAPTLIDLAEVLLGQGEEREGRRLLAEALQLTLTVRLEDWAARALEALCGAEVARGRPALALRWAGAALAWREQTSFPLGNAFARRRLDQAVAAARAALGDGPADAALAAGRQMPLDQAAEGALGGLTHGSAGGRTPIPF